MRIGAVLLFLFLLTPLAWSEAWVQKGSTWSHPYGISVTFPGDFDVKARPNGTLEAKAQGGYVSLVLTPAHGAADLKQAMQGANQALDAAGAQMQAQPTGGKQNGLEFVYKEGKAMSNKVPLYIKLELFQNKEKEGYLVVQLIMPEQLLAKNTALLKKVFDSIK